MKIPEILGNIGLSTKEVAVYLALIELGPSTVAVISRKAKLHRPAVYKTISFLIGRGLASQSLKGKQKHYVAEPPDKLKTFVSEIEREIEDFTPQLQALYASREKKPLVKFLEGSKEIPAVLDDIVETLPRDSVFYRYSAIKKAEQTEKYLPKDYRAKRDNKGLQRFVITNETVARDKKPRLERDIKVIPDSEGLFDYEVTQIVYGNKIAFIDYNSETVLLIENQKIAEFQKALFKALYKRL